MYFSSILNNDSSFILNGYENIIVFFISSFIVATLLLLLSSKYFQESCSRFKTKFIKPKNSVNAFEILSKSSPYFINLDDRLKARFIRRVEIFIDLKEFTSRNTSENQVVNLLISATAVQLTFGLKDFKIHSFDRILIYPDTYYNSIRKAYHKGEINIRENLIILSTKHFLSGLKDVNDGINLGLHEMAHALNVNAFEFGNEEFKYFFNQWTKEAIIEMENIRNFNNHFFRKYAATNIQEMFAVCTENFFEKPEEFQKKLPKLYRALCNVFKQNPIDKYLLPK